MTIRHKRYVLSRYCRPFFAASKGPSKPPGSRDLICYANRGEVKLWVPA
jgi:hypothetical protein